MKKFSILDALTDDHHSLVCLQETRTLTNADLDHEFWGGLSGDYQNGDYQALTAPALRAIVTILNALVHQRRVAFVLTRRGLKQLMKLDSDWDNGRIRDGDYPKVIACLSRYTQPVVHGDRHHVTIYLVTNPTDSR